MRYAVLGSGSSANSYIFESSKLSFVVDNGFTLAEFSKRAKQLSFDISKIKYIFLTHSHSDHSKGIALLSRKIKAPVIMNSQTMLDKIAVKKIYKTLNVTSGRYYKYENFSFSVFPLSHDVPGAVGYSFEVDNFVFTIITDTGIILKEMKDYAVKSDVLFLESNYCPQMLEEGPYPQYLKRRITSRYGHLSNNDAAEFLLGIYDKLKAKNKITYFCHLSDTNNCYEKIEEVIKSKMPDTFKYRICRKSELVEGIKI